MSDSKQNVLIELDELLSDFYNAAPDDYREKIADKTESSRDAIDKALNMPTESEDK